MITYFEIIANISNSVYDNFRCHQDWNRGMLILAFILNHFYVSAKALCRKLECPSMTLYYNLRLEIRIINENFEDDCTKKCLVVERSKISGVNFWQERKTSFQFRRRRRRNKYFLGKCLGHKSNGEHPDNQTKDFAEQCRRFEVYIVFQSPEDRTILAKRSSSSYFIKVYYTVVRITLRGWCVEQRTQS